MEVVVIVVVNVTVVHDEVVTQSADEPSAFSTSPLVVVFVIVMVFVVVFDVVTVFVAV